MINQPDICKIVCQDFRKFLSSIKDESINLVLTDPPYTISKKTGFAKLGKRSVERFAVSMDFGKWDHKRIDLIKLTSQAYRVLKKGGSAIIFYDIWKITTLADAMKVAGFKMLRLIIWEKTNPVPLNSKRTYLSNSREIAIIGAKLGKPTFNSEYDNGIYRYCIPNNGNRYHPTQKPLAFMRDLIIKHSHKNDIIIDPFLGSGTTAIAALQENRFFMGCEIDKKYVSISKKRVKDVKKMLVFRVS